MRFCPFCAHELQDEAERCVYCGKRLRDRKRDGQLSDSKGVALSADDAAPRPPPSSSVTEAPGVAPPGPPTPSDGIRATEPARPPVAAVPGDAPANSGAGATPEPDHASLTPIAAAAAPGLLAALSYLVQVVRGRAARRRLIRRARPQVRQALQAEESALAALGRAARERGTPCPGAEKQLQEVLALERQTAQLEQEKREQQQELASAEEHSARLDADLTQRCATLRLEIAETQSRLDERLAEQVEIKASIARQERQIKALERERDDYRERAPRVAEPSEREELQQLAAEKGIKIGDCQQAKAGTEQHLQRLQRPLTDLRVALQQANARLQQLERELAATEQQRSTERRRVEQGNRERDGAIETLARQQQLRLTELGRALDRQRARNADLQRSYLLIDARRVDVARLSRQTTAWEQECRRIDQRAYRKGLTVVLGAGLCLLALVVTALLL